jgi:hypothetical protein
MVERTVRITNLHDDSGAARMLAYWLSQPTEQRIAEVERLRREYYGIPSDGAFPPIQRVARIVALHDHESRGE